MDDSKTEKAAPTTAEEPQESRPQNKWYWRAVSAVFNGVYRAVKKANGENPS